jgi:hypothetical protein
MSKTRANTRKAKPKVSRVDRGRFAPGACGNPNGRPRVVYEVRELARQHGPDAIARLVVLMHSEDENVSVKACSVLLDRGYGRPEQSIAVAAMPVCAGDPFAVADPIEASRTYEQIMAGTISADAVRFTALPAPSAGPQSDDRTVGVIDAQSGQPEPPADARVAPIDDSKLTRTWEALGR